MGVTIKDRYLNIAVTGEENQPMYLLIYLKNGGRKVIKKRIPEEYRVGSVYGIRIEGMNTDLYSYNFVCGDREFTDPYAKAIEGCSHWGERKSRGLFESNDFSWDNDAPLELPYEDVILYLIHVRGFTKHKSSHVSYPGCFEGIIEKIPYLKSLLINQIELMPAYDFDERIKSKIPECAPGGNLPVDSSEFADLKEEHEIRRSREKKINYWGYTDALYFVPKSSYSGIQDSITSFKHLVKECHKAGIEVIMQFYFQESKNLTLILDCIRYWVVEYHIDGVHLLGNNIPIEIIATDPILSRIKISSEHIPADTIYSTSKEPYKKRLAEYDDSYMYDLRKFLKSDEDMLSTFANHQTCNPDYVCRINYLTNYYGFTMMDLVSFDCKHNEDNGEDNRDGNDYNYSWNCGAEGTSRKKSVKELRIKQIKNAFTMLLLGAGVPMIKSGDEFGHSQKGNNNSYCQDNDINWLNWKLLEKNVEIFEFVKTIIQFRITHSVFHLKKQLRLMDYKSCGYPDLSYHGEMAWYPRFENYNRHIGMMYCCSYGDSDAKCEDYIVYIAYNMFWQNKRFALPKLPKDKKWFLYLQTGRNPENEQDKPGEQTDILVPDRSITILIGK